MFTSCVKKCLKCLQLVIVTNRPFHSLWCHYKEADFDGENVLLKTFVLRLFS